MRLGIQKVALSELAPRVLLHFFSRAWWDVSGRHTFGRRIGLYPNRELCRNKTVHQPIFPKFTRLTD